MQMNEKDRIIQASNDKLTHYHTSSKRKSLISGIKGIVIHGHWKFYYQLTKVRHGLCNTHHLRELQALIENDSKEKWAKKMRKFLVFSCAYRYKFTKSIPVTKLKRLEKIYDRIVAEGLSYHFAKQGFDIFSIIQKAIIGEVPIIYSR